MKKKGGSLSESVKDGIFVGFRVNHSNLDLDLNKVPKLHIIAIDYSGRISKYGRGIIVVPRVRTPHPYSQQMIGFVLNIIFHYTTTFTQQVHRFCEVGNLISFYFSCK